MTVNHDHEREQRTNIPESVLAEPKSSDDLIKAIKSGMERNQKLLVTRILASQREIIRKLVSNKNWKYEFDAFERTLIIYTQELPKLRKLGVAIFAAGTSDRFIVEEIKLCLKFFGWQSHSALDVGVAGLHRFKKALNGIHEDPTIHCLIVVAGQDGALFPVIAGQTKLPIIAVPSPIGYGFGGKGEAALMSALQACAPGIAVVNIENGFGAASIAAKILARIDDSN
ncbi:MAG: nickel pincer cofactor biosynthesis protein LarB [Candidatus Kariarchaeaceae archaeon]|jgi:NCAIR mutase (PurE)-related protein